QDQGILQVQEALRNLTELANRAAVSFYTVDARGLDPLLPTAGDDLSGDIDNSRLAGDVPPGNEYTRWLEHGKMGISDRQMEFVEAQEGLRELASDTGGFFVQGTNDLSFGVRRVLRDQEGYYLLGFVPEESTFKGKNASNSFHNLKVIV